VQQQAITGPAPVFGQQQRGAAGTVEGLPERHQFPAQLSAAFKVGVGLGDGGGEVAHLSRRSAIVTGYTGFPHHF
jgi:hypothetical protein